MNVYVKYLVCFFLCIMLALQGTPPEIRKNLEIKLQVDSETFDGLKAQLVPYYAETLYQTDTYFRTKEGRLKLREESGKNAYLVHYERPDLEEAKQSNYLFYPVDDVNLFLSVLGGSLIKEIQVKKQRMLYFPKPYIRVHLDQVENLGSFLEIEIILSKEVPLTLAETDMNNLQDWLKLRTLPKMTKGYRELLQQRIAMQQPSEHKNFSYYKNQNKVFWVIADDLAVGHFKRYDVIPCIFVERFENGSYGIIQLDPKIAVDGFQYTAWRKLIGQEHNFRAEVLLIDTSNDKLYTLSGEEIAFDSLIRSSRLIDRSYLAPFSKIN